jgi:DNA-binding response OmpR family regulator
MAQTILYVDDEEALQDLVAAYLTAEGYAVTTAGDGREAMRLLSEGAFDIVLLDLHLPLANGLEVLEFIKGKGIPSRTIILSGDESILLQNVSNRWGADDHLSKPFDFDELLSVLKRSCAA